MTKQKTVCIINGNYQYAEMFLKNGYKGIHDPHQADLVCFTGGEDVTPSFYKQTAIAGTHFNPARDAKEQTIFEALDTAQVCVGICRGGQFLNVMNGGSMWQDVDSHGQSHFVHDFETKKEYWCSSTHHQMMRHSQDGEVVGADNRAKIKRDCWNTISRTDILHTDEEVIWYPKTKSLCFQPHPEFNMVEPCRRYFFELLERFS